MHYIDVVTFREKKALDAQGQCLCTIPYPTPLSKYATQEEFEAYEEAINERFDLCIQEC